MYVRDVFVVATADITWGVLHHIYGNLVELHECEYLWIEWD